MKCHRLIYFFNFELNTKCWLDWKFEAKVRFLCLTLHKPVHKMRLILVLQNIKMSKRDVPWNSLCTPRPNMSQGCHSPLFFTPITSMHEPHLLNSHTHTHIHLYIYYGFAFIVCWCYLFLCLQHFFMVQICTNAGQYSYFLLHFGYTKSNSRKCH